MQDGTGQELRPRPLASAGLQERVLDELRQAIVGGEYTPGMALSEVALAQAFGISRTPVREAIKQLQVEGLVKVVPRVGTFVAEASRRDVVELFELKEVLEGLAARLLAMRGRVAEVDRLVESLRESEAAVSGGEAERYAGLVHEFHGVIVEGADNANLASHYRTLMNQLAYHRLVLTSLSRPGRPDRSVAEHRTVLERILAKDPHGAEAAMRDHVRASHRELMAGLDGPSDPSLEKEA
jgi:DNA-binding GntR family transcriptional regulator